MKDFVSSRQVSISAVVASLLILWAMAVVPGGPAWALFVALGVLAVLLAATTNLVQRAAAPASMSEVIRDVEGEPKAGDPALVRARGPAAR